MKRESFQGILLGIVIMCAVFAFITIAWAAFSSTLTIDGSATIKKQSWKIHFTDDVTKDYDAALTAFQAKPGNSGASVIYLTGNTNSSSAILPTVGANPDAFAITANNTVGGDLGTLNMGGDEVTYTWYAQNFGTFDATASLTTDGGLFTSAPSGHTAGGNIQATCVDKDNSGNNSTAQAFCDTNLTVTLKVNDTNYNKSNFNLLAKDDSATTDQVKFTLTVAFKDTGSANNPSVSSQNIGVTIPTMVLTLNQGTTVAGG